MVSNHGSGSAIHAVLLSMKPEHAERILNGTKRFEYRKAVPLNESVRTVVFYATMRSGRSSASAKLTAKHMGAIDLRGLREMVEEVLEGGRRVFELRRQKYGF